MVVRAGGRRKGPILALMVPPSRRLHVLLHGVTARLGTVLPLTDILLAGSCLGLRQNRDSSGDSVLGSCPCLRCRARPRFVARAVALSFCAGTGVAGAWPSEDPAGEIWCGWFWVVNS